MNKKIKRLVSSVLAATIAFASITVNIPVLSKVGGVVDVYAGDVATGTYSLNFSDAFSAENLTVGESSVAVSDSNNIINYTPAANSQSTYHSTGYGLAIKSADPITVQVSGDANISFQVSKWADENGYFNVTNSNGDDLGTLSSYNATDKAYNTFQYRGEETTLTFSYSGGTSYVVSITAEWLGTVTTDTEITAGEYSLDFSTKYSGTASQSYVTGSVSSVKDVITYAPSNNSSKYWGSTYGLYMASGEKVTVQVIGDANISFVVSKYSDANSEFTVTNSNGTNLGTVSAYNATDLASNTFEYKGAATTLTFTLSGGNSYVKSVTAVLTDTVTQQETEESNEYTFWFDEQTTLEKGTKITMDNGSTVTLLGEFALAKNYTYEGHTSYQASPAKAEANGAAVGNGAATIPDNGNAFAFDPVGKGTCVIAAGTADGKSINVVTVPDEGTATGTTKEIGSGNFVTIQVEEGNTYYICGNNTTGNSAFIGLKYIVDVPVAATFTVDYPSVLGDATLKLVDAATAEEITVKTDGTATTIYAGHEYELESSDPTVSAKISDSTTFTASSSTTEYTINVEKLANVTLSGIITGTEASNVTALGFVNTKTNVQYDATITGSTYTVDLPAGDYTTTYTTTNGATTSNRVYVPANGKTDEEVYFVIPSTIVYSPSSITTLTSTNYVQLNNSHVSYNNGAVLTVPVSGASKVSVTGYYSGSFTFNDDTEVKSVATGGTSTKNTHSYTTDGTETSVTINIKENNTYLTEIKVEKVVPTKTNISVPGDYDTLQAAVNAAANMDTDETITITLTSDLNEQVNVTADNIVINGAGHTLSWYYAYGAEYYSVDSDGYYNEELFRDKYSKTPAKANFWGGVMIVRGDNVRVEDLTIKNTFNYTVTAKELEDGVEYYASNSTHGTAWSRTTAGDTTVQTSANRERANALAVFGDKAEFYNCSILSSQDTLGVNGDAASSHAYFNNCTIGGNVDYICGGGTMVFEKCKLQWFNDGSNKGYITAPRISSCPYVFLNCEITAESTLPSGFAGYYGRPWLTNKNSYETTATAYFINTNAKSGSINDAGWINWTNDSADTSAENANFYELSNYKEDKKIFASSKGDALEISDYNTLINGLVSTTLGGWTPKYYNAPVVTDIVIADDVKIDGENYVLVYGQVSDNDLDKADEAGFVFSKAKVYFDTASKALSEEVYSKVTYTNTSDETTVLEAPAGYYYSIAVFEKDAAIDKTLYAIAADSNTFGEVVTAVTAS